MSGPNLVPGRAPTLQLGGFLLPRVEISLARWLRVVHFNISRYPTDDAASRRASDGCVSSPPEAPAASADPLRGLAVQAAGDYEAQQTVLVTLGPALVRVIRGVLAVE